jgi:tetratricopeptide (TPR) repeat protein
MNATKLSACLFLLLGCQGLRPETADPIVFDVGAVHREITTSSPEAQLWFDRGLGMAYGFNSEEAIRCFERAAEADPGCAMAYWGKAWAGGPNYNSPTLGDAASLTVFEAHQAALAALDDESAVERDLVRALGARYAWPAPESRASLELAYADAMRELYAAYPDDADIAALLGEALMQLRPWGMWSPDGEPAPELAEIRGVLEPALERWPDHPALCHFYIHAMEAGPEVARAIPAARRLERLTPGMGHLVHMPSHIYVWTGNYDDVVRTNLEAVEADDAFVSYAGRENFYSAYRIHNYHFVAYGAMWEGRRELAMEYARRLVREIPSGLLAEVPDLFEVFNATPYHVMVRFGMWEELLREPAPADALLATRAVWRYARGVAFASLGRVEEALAEQQAFRTAAAAVPASRRLFNNPVAEVLGVADNVLAGEIAYRQRDYDRAFELLRAAVVLDENLNYDEPWGWMEPAEHALGALLTEQGEYAEALAVYRANLERYPNNGWALNGLAECLRGLGRVAEADEAQARFEAAFARADVQIPGSCYCRTGA